MSRNVHKSAASDGGGDERGDWEVGELVELLGGKDNADDVSAVVLGIFSKVDIVAVSERDLLMDRMRPRRQ